MSFVLMNFLKSGAMQYRNQLKQFRESQESPELTEALEAGIAGNAQADVSGSIEDAPSKP